MTSSTPTSPNAMVPMLGGMGVHRPPLRSPTYSTLTPEQPDAVAVAHSGARAPGSDPRGASVCAPRPPAAPPPKPSRRSCSASDRIWAHSGRHRLKSTRIWAESDRRRPEFGAPWMDTSLAVWAAWAGWTLALWRLAAKTGVWMGRSRCVGALSRHRAKPRVARLGT